MASRSEGEREREPRMMMMMENKRGVEPYAEDDDGEQMSLAARYRMLMFGLHKKD